jgi:DNA-binding IscR family transcriptional regulator
MAQDFQARATAMRKSAVGNNERSDGYALGLDSAAASLMEVVREMETGHQPIREDESNCPCVEDGNPESCACACHQPITLVQSVAATPVLDEFLSDSSSWTAVPS